MLSKFVWMNIYEICVENKETKETEKYYAIKKKFKNAISSAKNMTAFRHKRKLVSVDFVIKAYIEKSCLNGVIDLKKINCIIAFRNKKCMLFISERFSTHSIFEKYKSIQKYYGCIEKLFFEGFKFEQDK